MILIAGWGCVFDDITLTYYLDFNCIHCPYVHCVSFCCVSFSSCLCLCVVIQKVKVKVKPNL